MTNTDFGSQYSLQDLSCAFKKKKNWGGGWGGGCVRLLPRVKLFLFLRSH